MNERVQQQRHEELIEKMPKLKIGQEGLREAKDVPLSILEHVFQAPGALFKYDIVLDNNIPISDRLLINMQKIEGEGELFKWLLHVTDQENKLSYQRLEITPETQIQMM